MKFGISADTEQKVLVHYNKMVVYPNPSSGTFPSSGPAGGRVGFYKRIEQDTFKYHCDFIRKYEHKKWWRQLKETLGEEYLENLRKQCYYMIAA